MSRFYQHVKDKMKSGGAHSPIGKEEIVEATPDFRRAKTLAPEVDLSLVKCGTLMAKPNLNFRRSSAPQLRLKELGISSATWAVKTPKELPFYPLERTVQIDQPASVVASRVSDCLRKRSVAATFVDAEATCMTGCHLKFMIRLFAAEDAGSTIIEVQRRKGCSLAFRRERQAIINAANGVACSKDDMPPCLSLPACVAALYTPPSDDELKCIVEKSRDELESSSLDGQLTTLRILAAMTNPEKSHAETSRKIAEMIVSRHNGIRDILHTILTSSTPDEAGGMMRNAVLSILSNTLNVLSKDGKLEVVTKEDGWFKMSLYPALVLDLERCHCPHSACLSSQCLCVLFKNSSALRELATEGTLMPILESAVTRGAESHMKLYNEAESTINALRSQ
jgi:hypothetical protein